MCAELAGVLSRIADLAASIDEVTAVLYAALLAGSLAFLIDWLRRRDERKRLERQQAEQRRAVAAAFLGEIRGLREIVRERRYEHYIDEMIAEHEAGTALRVPLIKVRRRPDPIFQANSGLIGLMPASVAELLGRHYVLLNSILEDLDAFVEGTWFDDAQKPSAVKEMRGLLGRMVAIEDELVEKLGSLAAGDGPTSAG